MQSKYLRVNAFPGKTIPDSGPERGGPRLPKASGDPQAARAIPIVKQDQSAIASLAPARPLRTTSQSM
jgi:hypothetical protein